MPTRLREDFSDLPEDKVKYNFNDTLYLLCYCNIGIGSIVNNFVHCHFCTINQTNVINDLRNTDASLPVLDENNIIKLFFYADDLFYDNNDQSILIFTRFSEHLFWLVK